MWGLIIENDLLSKNPMLVGKKVKGRTGMFYAKEI